MSFMRGGFLSVILIVLYTIVLTRTSCLPVKIHGLRLISAR